MELYRTTFFEFIGIMLMKSEVNLISKLYIVSPGATTVSPSPLGNPSQGVWGAPCRVLGLLTHGGTFPLLPVPMTNR